MLLPHLLQPSKLPGHVSIRGFETAVWQSLFAPLPLRLKQGVGGTRALALLYRER